MKRTHNPFVDPFPSLICLIYAEELTPRALSVAVSDITWDSFNVSWSPPSGSHEFEGFVIELTNLENPVQSENLTLAGDAFSLLVSGLNPDTGYMVAVYGMHHEGFLEPVYTEATTGTRGLQSLYAFPPSVFCGSFFFFLDFFVLSIDFSSHDPSIWVHTIL